VHAAGHHLDQGGLARAVVADQGVHLPGGYVQVHAAQRLDGPVGLTDAAQPQQRRRRGGAGRAGHRGHEFCGQSLAGMPWHSAAQVVAPSFTATLTFGLVITCGASSRDGTAPAPLSVVVLATPLTASGLPSSSPTATLAAVCASCG